MSNNHNTDYAAKIEQLLMDYSDVLSGLSNKNHVLQTLTKFKIETWKWFKKQGESDRSVAKSLGISNTSISHWRKKIGLERWKNTYDQ